MVAGLSATAIPAQLAPLAEQALPPDAPAPRQAVQAPPVPVEFAPAMPAVSPSSAAAAPVSPLPTASRPVAAIKHVLIISVDGL